MAAAQGHISVLPKAVIEYLDAKPGATYCDGTLGAGGHTRLLAMAAQPGGKVIAIDRDPTAHRLAEENLGDTWQHVEAVRGSFGNVAKLFAERGITQVDGFVLDLGVSSMQLDNAERGFSFGKSGPIDMRMDPDHGETALELIRRLSEPELGDIVRTYGEERYHRRVARAMKEAAREGELSDTESLAKVVSDAIPAPVKRKMRIHPATKTFQALRIAVNGELKELEDFLAAFPMLLPIGGRCVIISFHSLEDRLVKHRFRDLAQSSSLPPKYAEAAGERVHPICKILTRKAVIADAEEIAENPRSRSAKLRACEKVSDE